MLQSADGFKNAKEIKDTFAKAKLSLDGRLVWEFEYSSDRYLSHHDIAPMPNGNILLLVLNLPLIGLWVKVLKIPQPLLYAAPLDGPDTWGDPARTWRAAFMASMLDQGHYPSIRDASRRDRTYFATLWCTAGCGQNGSKVPG